ncbi:hypothetical protein NIES2100_66350 [Calothrix sp. NIES-2100]|uniref:hypothetical protein n=1 Tax=Calothrix sp. NIES-2100 TaxID=1954172 RepID=UPI000B60FD9D|nr:hypothetical protein NIES2100_66350 [Calothrix sp. NIES-2100]
MINQKMGNLKIYKQTKVIIDEICNKERLSRLKDEKLDVDVLTAITEIVSICMRDIAKENEHFISENKFVEQAVAKAKIIFRDKLFNDGYENYYQIIEKYLNIAKRNLTRKPPSSNKSSFAKSILDIKNQEIPGELDNLKTDNQKENVYNDLVDILLNSPIAKSKNTEFKELKLIKIGFNNYIEGLLIYPELQDLEEYTLNLKYLPDQFEVEISDNFPIEIYHEDYLYILDDDGSIFVNVENYNSDNFFQAGRLLIELAMSLYNQTET